MRQLAGLILFIGTLLTTAGRLQAAAESSDERLIEAARPFLTAVSGRATAFDLHATVRVPIDGRVHTLDVQATRHSMDAFDLSLTHADYAVAIRRRADRTALALPKHQMVYLGTGPLGTPDHLGGPGLWQRLVSTDSDVANVVWAASLAAWANPEEFLRSLLQQSALEYDADSESWANDEMRLQLESDGTLLVNYGAIEVQVRTRLEAVDRPAVDAWPGWDVRELPRDELESTLVRGVRRATEILRPGQALLHPPQEERAAANGRLQWIGGQRVAVLWGTPEELGAAHGQLLQDESRRCIESVLYTFGTAHVIRTGRWFRHDLEDAFARLNPHIPERHKREIRALAQSLDIDPHQAEILNVFPELFHCSGFAVFGSATVDGKLYHGRVLDYMTTIGLQDAATTFVVQPTGRIPFVNVGYGGFTGSVSGMNVEGISLGEMGGRGEGDWDGVPMATLMRRALEECRTLDDVRTLWSESPRTCEYYYVFADGKTNDAVGVAATPDRLQFVEPGESHELLGDGIADAVVLSAGSRLEELRRRVTDRHGAIDADVAMWLMSRPVAMESNLHNVLFVPQDGVLYVANAGHSKPAADMPYVRLELRTLLDSAANRPLTRAGGGSE